MTKREGNVGGITTQRAVVTPSLETLLGRRATELGLVGLGISRSRAYRNVKLMLEERDILGYRDDMQFTYRNPSRSTSCDSVLPQAKSVVTAGLYYGDNQGNNPGASVIARYAKFDAYGNLRRNLTELAQVLLDGGYRAKVVLDSNATVDKEAALRSGSGTYMKNSLISIPRYGTMVVLGNIVTDAKLLTTPRQPRLIGCGSCDACVRACPTGAILDGGVIDARRCISWVLQRPGSIPVDLRSAIGTRVYGCDTCQDVCPYNRGAAPLTPSLAQVVNDLSAILAMTDDAILQRFAHLYIHKRDPAIIRRNALAALGNVRSTNGGNWSDIEVLLEKYLRAKDPVLAEQAAFSLARHREAAK